MISAALAPVHLTLAASSDAASGVGIPLALAAGLVSFLSPCVLPLVPGYLSTVIGVTPADLKETGPRRVLIPSLLFIASFSLIFILLGMSATVIGSTSQIAAISFCDMPGWRSRRARMIHWARVMP